MEWNYFESVQRAKRGYARALEPVCSRWSLTRSELDVLLYLANNPGFDRAADIVANRGMVKSQVSMSVSRLLDRGLLARREDGSDRRTVHLQLTEAADEIIRTGREALDRFFCSIFEGVTREELEYWHGIASRIGENISRIEGG